MARAHLPQTAFQSALHAAQVLPGMFGRFAARKLKRRLRVVAQTRFDEVLKTLGPGDVVLDLGANLGDVSDRLAETGATVHAYEPDPDIFDRLKARLGNRPNVKLFPQAVGHEAGELLLYRARADVLENEDLRVQAGSILFVNRHSDRGNAVPVQVISFDEAIRRAGGRAKVVKMDIEGAETAILTGLFPPNLSDADLPRLHLPFDHLFVETHEKLFKEQLPEILRLRRLAEKLQAAEVNLYWH